jgi:glycosyltransferase involved in cell wall biosynthesis
MRKPGGFPVDSYYVESKLMATKPLVSVITIFLNAEKFIHESIGSVFAQTYQNWELLLVDDGSTDTSSEIARRFAEQHSEKVRYFEHDGHKNRGTAGSINELIDEGWDGVLVPQRDPVALGNVIQTFLRDPDRRRQLGREAADNIRRRFDVRVCEETFTSGCGL